MKNSFCFLQDFASQVSREVVSGNQNSVDRLDDRPWTAAAGFRVGAGRGGDILRFSIPPLWLKSASAEGT